MGNAKVDYEYEVVVVGAGVIGSATAYYLSKEVGEKALLLEQFDFLHRRGSSHGDSRIIKDTAPQDYYTELMFDAYKLWDEAEHESCTKVFTKTGCLEFGPKDSPVILNVIENAKKFGIEHQVFQNASQLSKRFPMVKLLPNHLAVWSPSSGILNATKSVAMFQQLAKSRGCHLRDNVKVVNISQNPQTSVITLELENGEKILTRKCIVTSAVVHGQTKS